MNIWVLLLRELAFTKERGATAAEYALMISGIALALVGATVWLGTKLSDAYGTITSALF